MLFHSSLRIAGCRGCSSADFVCVPLACVQLLYLCLCFRPLAFQAFVPPCVATVRMNIPHLAPAVNRFLHFFWIFLRFFCGWRLAFFYTGPSTELRGPEFGRVQGQDAVTRGGVFRHFCKVKCQIGQIPNQVRDDGLH